MARETSGIRSIVRSLRTWAGVCGLSIAVVGCAPNVATRGNLVEDTRLNQIVVGSSTANDVVALIGTPTTEATFDQQTWYYIGQRTEQMAFFEPEITDRRIIVIRFTETGVVEDIRELGLDEAREVAIVERETPTLGRQITFLEQIIGNLGRFNAERDLGPRIPGT